MAEDHYVGWLLEPAERAVLLTEIKPAYAKVVAHHVTLVARVGADAPLPKPVRASIVGIADDGVGVQALVVRIDGTTDRPDGGTYHITWSLAEGREAVESNVVIKALGWKALPPRNIRVEPMRDRMSK